MVNFAIVFVFQDMHLFVHSVSKCLNISQAEIVY